MTEPIPLRDYVDRLLDEHRQHHVREQEVASIAREALSTRLEGMNEVREQLRQQASVFVSQDAFRALEARVSIGTETAGRQHAGFVSTAAHGEHAKRLDKLEAAQSRLVGMWLAITGLIAVIGITATVVVALVAVQGG